jgi:hypothetical protein
MSLIVFTKKISATSSADPAEEMKDDEDLTSPPRSLSTETVSDKKCPSKHTSSALCLWLIATLSRLNSDA